jgi:hypothetical protein
MIEALLQKARPDISQMLTGVEGLAEPLRMLFFFGSGPF